MFWFFLTVLVIVGGLLSIRRKAAVPPDDEPWRQSLEEDEPLDLEEIERAEKEWLESEGWDEAEDDESWR